jgi:hypothetical protein
MKMKYRFGQEDCEQIKVARKQNQDSKSTGAWKCWNLNVKECHNQQLQRQQAFIAHMSGNLSESIP